MTEISAAAQMRALLSNVDRTADSGGYNFSQAHVATGKLVKKHWGEERWLVMEGSPFGFKLITILAGRRTSLQYHEIKEEANLVLAGEGRLYVGSTPSAKLESCLLVPGQIAHIRAGMVHRIEAVTDLILVEVSTPELDDVVRLQDDEGRGDGRIDAEHAQEGM